MPKSKALPYEWYNTPNIHLFTLRDFIKLCKDNGMVVKSVVPAATSLIGRLLIGIGKINLGAEHLVIKIERQEQPQ